MSADPQRARAIFLEAVEKHAPEQWGAFLDAACEGDKELRERVNVLLQAHAQANSLLDAPESKFVPTVDEPAPAGFAGTVIGPYKLLEPIGEGGMGTVWMAQQTEPVKRLVALKLIKPGMDSRQVIARFEAERQALALMDHPNIAKVLDAGTTDPMADFRLQNADFKSEISNLKSAITAGRPYFVMELVKGVPLTKYCDEHRLTPRERLELFVPVCQAIQHAHQKGIIHRDIKPSNVLVALYDGRPVPKVIDFGVAKATGQQLTEHTLVTGFGAVVGTLEYMSPEQAEVNQLDIDTRSDIYSLGVLLYELLTGTTPLDRKRLKEAAMLEVLRMIREDEPPRPSTRLSDSKDSLPSISSQRHMEPAKLTKLVRGELDWIVMKALEKDRNRRYETANGFAMDVQRYLADEAVLACPPSAWYRLRKVLRRNKGAVLAASLVIASLLAGIVGTSWGMLEARTAAAAEKHAKEAAQERESEIKAVLEFVESKVFAAALPEGADGGLGREVSLRRAVEAALPFVAESFSNQPLIGARLRVTLGKSFRYLGEAQTASELCEAARELYTKHLGHDKPDTLWSMTELATCYFDLGRHPEALKLREETLALQRAKLGPGDRETLGSMHNLAQSYFALGRHADAFKLCEETLALRKARLGPDHRDTIDSMSNLASSYFVHGRYEDALKLRNETLAIQKAKLGPEHPATLVNINNLVANYIVLGRAADGVELLEKTLAIQKVKLGESHHDTLNSMNNLANGYIYLRRYPEGLKLLEQTLALRKAKFGADHPDTLQSMNNLASAYSTLNRKTDALKLREESLALHKAKFGPDHPETILSMGNLAKNLFELGRGAEALPIADECLKRANGQVVHPALIPMVIRFRLLHFVTLKDTASCRATADMLEKLDRTDPESLYVAATCRAITAVMLKRDPKFAAEATLLAESETDRAMAWLKKAVAAGYKNVEHLKQDYLLEPLRVREDFKKLLAELEAKSKE
jgi:serine/threonine protein kinase